jgi:release factor glutamine methyltransferase
MSTIAQALQAARGKLIASEARLLLGHVVERPAVWLLAHDDTKLTENQLTLFAALCGRRQNGEPIAYLLGTREFYGREFRVAPGVLIPRPETELLVEIALEKVGVTEGNPLLGTGGTALERPRVLDLGTGSGCIAISIALECPRCAVVAVDASPAALEIATDNAQHLNANVRFLASDWFAALNEDRFALVVSNPPYIAAADRHLAQGDLVHEPISALASGDDGLDAIRHIIANATRFLQPGGSLWLEHGYDQAIAVGELLCAAGFVMIEQHKDLAGIVRVSGGALR